MHQIECSHGHISVANDLRSSHHMDKHATLDSVRCAHDQGNSAIIGVVVVEYILFAETNCGANQVSSKFTVPSVFKKNSLTVVKTWSQDG